MRKINRYSIPLLAILLCCTCTVQGQLATTFAGTGATGYNDDSGTNAAFNWPINIVIDAGKNMFVTDADNNMIRKITPTGVVSTFAGALNAGVTNGTGTAARFNHPLGLAIDAAGNLYVSDSKNNAVRKITPAGVTSLFAGTGNIGHADGPALMATFNYPNGLTVDDSDNVYVADASNNMIRKITQAGIVSTVAGSVDSGWVDDTGMKAKFAYPCGLAADDNGNLYVVDKSNNMIRKIAPGGIVTTYAGSTTAGTADGTGPAAGFASPYGITIDGTGNLYVAEIGSDLIREVTPARQVTTLMGIAGAMGATDGLRDVATFNNPTGLALDGNGNLFVADWNNNEIRKIELGYTGIFTPRKPANVSPYPNPAHDLVTIPANVTDEIIVYNLLGAEIYHAAATQNNPAIITKGLAAGVYSVKTITKGSAAKYGKFVKE